MELKLEGASPLTVPETQDSALDRYAAQVEQAEDRILADAWAAMIDAGEPLGALVLVEVQAKIVESISAGGLVMPGGLPLRVATVISVGPGYWDGRNMCHVPLGLQVGDRVVLRGSAGIPIDPIRDLRLLPPGDTLFRIPREEETLALTEPVSRLGLPTKTHNAIKDIMPTIGDLVIRNEGEMFRCRKLGRTGIQQIKDALARFGLKFSDDG